MVTRVTGKSSSPRGEFSRERGAGSRESGDRRVEADLLDGGRPGAVQVELAMGGVGLAWFFYMVRPDIPAAIQRTFRPLHALLENKYFFDRFNEIVFAGGSRQLGKGLWKGGDQGVIDSIAVNGTARLVGWVAQISRLFQTGHLYQYAFAMIIGVFILLTFWFNLG